MMKTVTAAALLVSGVSGAFAQSVEFNKIHEGAQVAGVCGSPLSQAQENKVAQVAAVSAGGLRMGEVLSSETKVRSDARVQAYSLGCQDTKNVQAIQYYSGRVK